MPLIKIDNLKKNGLKNVTTLRHSMVSKGDIIVASDDKNFSFGSTELMAEVYQVNKRGTTVEYDSDGNLIKASPATSIELDSYVIADTNTYIAEVEKLDKNHLISTSRKRIGNKIKHPLYVVPGKTYIFECRFLDIPFIAAMTVGDVTYTRESDYKELPINFPKNNSRIDAMEHFKAVLETLKNDKKLGVQDMEIEKPSDIENLIKKLPNELFLNFYDKNKAPIAVDLNVDAIYPVE